MKEKTRVDLTLPIEFVQQCKEKRINMSGIITDAYHAGSFSKWIGNGTEYDREEWYKKCLHGLLYETTLPQNIKLGIMDKPPIRHWASVLHTKEDVVVEICKSFNNGLRNVEEVYKRFFES